MKALNLILAVTILLSIHGYCQTHTDKFEFPLRLANNTKGQLIIAYSSGNITIIGHAQNKFIITADPQNISRKPEIKKDSIVNGVPKLITYGTLMQITNDENMMVVKSTQFDKGNDVNLVIYVPYECDIRAVISINGNLKIDNVKGKLDLLNQIGSITVSKFSGSIVALAKNGDMNVSFDQISELTPSSLTGLNNPITVNIPADSSIDFKLKTSTGKIYNDARLKFFPQPEDWSISSLNGGKASLTIQTRYGFIDINKNK